MSTPNQVKSLSYGALVRIVGKALYDWGDDEPNSATGYIVATEVHRVTDAVWAALTARDHCPEGRHVHDCDGSIVGGFGRQS